MTNIDFHAEDHTLTRLDMRQASVDHLLNATCPLGVGEVGFLIVGDNLVLFAR